MNFSPKYISVLSLVQLAFIVGGSLFTRSCLKLYDIAVTTGLPVPAPSLAIFVRTYGLYFMLVPIGWTALATIRGRAVRGIAFISTGQLITGSALAVAIVILFVLGSYQALEALH